MIHLEPIVYTLRVYEDGKSLDNYDPYIFVATVMKIDNETAHVRAGLGIFPLNQRKEILRLLKETIGVSKVKWMRSSGKIMEFET